MARSRVDLKCPLCCFSFASPLLLFTDVRSNASGLTMRSAIWPAGMFFNTNQHQPTLRINLSFHQRNFNCGVLRRLSCCRPEHRITSYTDPITFLQLEGYHLQYHTSEPHAGINHIAFIKLKESKW